MKTSRKIEELPIEVQPPVGRCQRCGITVFFNSNPQPALCTGCQKAKEWGL